MSRGLSWMINCGVKDWLEAVTYGQLLRLYLSALLCSLSDAHLRSHTGDVAMYREGGGAQIRGRSGALVVSLWRRHGIPKEGGGHGFLPIPAAQIQALDVPRGIKFDYSPIHVCAF